MKLPPTARSQGRYVFDLETNGLLPEVTRVHCAVLYDLDTEEVLDFRPHEIGKFLELYVKATLLVGHNVIGFDIPVLQKIYGISPARSCDVIDTIVLAKLVFSDIKSIDFPRASAWKKYREARDLYETERAARIEAGEVDPGPFPWKTPHEFPGQFVGAHSLEAWGYRIGAERKGDYAKEMKAQGLDPWASWNEAMHAYMIQDAVVNVGVYRYLMAEAPTALSMQLEMDVQRLCCRMERNGWPLNVKAAQALYARLCQRRHELEKQLVEAFPPWRVRLEDFIPKRDNKTRGYKAGVPVERWETREFNPASRDHIADRLIDKYGWRPSEFTDGGQPKVDDDVLQRLPFPEAKLLAEYFLIQKRIGQLGEGNQAWLKQVTPKGRIHARYNTNGAVTGRATHSNPNIAQVPSVGAEYGWDCRVLFHVPRGWTQLGADQSGLELRCLGSFLAAFDGGAYIEVVLHGDVHWENAKALFGLADDLERDPDNPQHKKMRDVAKTFIYAFLYGAGDAKLGSIIGKGAKAGAQLRARFLKKFPALDRLIKAVKAAAAKGWLKGLDGRKLPVRSDHAALNTLLQSAGALVCKSWITLAEKALVDAGFKLSDALHGDWDPEADVVFLGWIHDELQVAVRQGLEDQVSAILIETGRRAGEPFVSWKCPTDVDVKPGANWAECH
ncbi:DNA polymerase [Sphingomonas asaccharolytica]|uniref:DNA polymerase n=1 Tax=Sphingomonas asaccharolytica TaxID=40681 RepID=UPI000A031E76|nr:DNA polymerase [Sphingomonas asaccharolytica]